MLMRFGRPANWRTKGTDAEAAVTERALWGQHNAHWIKPKLPGAGHVLVFNNGFGTAARRGKKGENSDRVPAVERGYT